MLSLRKSLHTLLGFSDPDDRRDPSYRCRNIPLPDGGLLRLLAGDPPKPPHVVESAVVGPTASPPAARVDAGSRGLLHPDHGDHCTESIGSESCDGEAVEEAEMEEKVAAAAEEEKREWGQPRRRREAAKADAKRFPPPLPWLVGRRSLFFRVVKEDGRVRLTEVRMERPEIFHASRHDGRLRLELIGRNGSANLEAEKVAKDDEMEEGKEETEMEMEEEKERWEVGRMTRCQDAVNGNDMPMWWSHRFVTTA
ncbi:uncharacterized protein [Typha latifolia]|uniref:uncharacterized protein n=1 Tax=Typha latifolia TaxID=4733 RepID=UPI003C305D93